MELNKADLRFIKSYHKKKSYGKEANINSREFDISKNQANKKTVNEVNEAKDTNYKYKYFRHQRRIFSFLPQKEAKRLDNLVNIVNEYAEAKSS